MPSWNSGSSSMINSLLERYPESETFAIGALIEPIGCAYNGIFISGGGLRPGVASTCPQGFPLSPQFVQIQDAMAGLLFSTVFSQTELGP